MNRVCLLAISGIVLAVAPVAAQTQLVSNLDQPVDGVSAGGSYSGIAQSFTTDASGWQLTSVVLIGMDNGDASTHHVSIYSDSSGLPGTELMQLDGAFPNQDTTTEASFTPPAPLVLGAGTTYWVVLIAPSLEEVRWAYSKTLISSGPGTLGNYAAFTGGSWTAYAGGLQSTEVNGLQGVPVQLQSLAVE